MIVKIIDNITEKEIATNEDKIISMGELNLILEALGYANDVPISLSRYSNEYDKRLGRGCSLVCDDGNHTSRIGKYTNGKVLSLKVSSTISGDNKDYIYSIRYRERGVELTKKGWILKSNDNKTSVAKYFDQNNCVEYEITQDDCLFSCSLDLGDSPSEGVIANEELLLTYFKTLRFPRTGTILDVYKSICDITGLSPRLQVTKADVVTDKVEFGLEDDEYEVIITSGQEVITCTKKKSSYIKHIVPEGESAPTEPILRVELIEETGIRTFSIIEGPSCSQNDIVSYTTNDLLPTHKRAMHELSRIKGLIDPHLKYHSDYQRNLKKHD